MDWLSNDVCEDFANVGISCSNSDASRMYGQNPSQHYGCDKNSFLEMPYLDNHVHNGLNGGHDCLPMSAGMHNGSMNGMSDRPRNGMLNGNVFPEEWDLVSHPKKICMDVKQELEHHNIEAADSTAEICHVSQVFILLRNEFLEPLTCREGISKAASNHAWFFAQL